MKSKILKVFMVLTILIYAIFNIIYIASCKGYIKCFGASMLFESVKTSKQKTLNLVLFMVFILILTITYIVIVVDEKEDNSKVQSSNKTDKSNKDNKADQGNNKVNPIKGILTFIAIVSILAGIILPNNSSDVYYYMAAGRLDAKYGMNMYDVSVEQGQMLYKDDNIIQNSPAIEHKFIYGAVWALICKIVGILPGDSVLLHLYFFKILNIIVHILNCYLIYKISKNKKLVLIYGLNPLLLFEGIINCHNDIYLVLFILLAIYLKKENKKGLSVLSIALGTLIKYVPIILLPYIIFERDESLLANKEIEKEKHKGVNKYKLFLKSKRINWKYVNEIVMYISEFVLIFVGLSFIVTGGFSKILSVLDQTGKYANSLYLQMHLMGVPWKVIHTSALVGKILFCIIFAIQVVARQRKDGKTYMYLMMIFLLLVITNFRTWYIMWLFGLITELKSEDVQKVVALSLIGTLANYIMYYLGEGYIFGGLYFINVVLAFAIFLTAQKIVNYKRELNC